MRLFLTVSLAAAFLSAPFAMAAEKTYQVTGPVTELTDSTITVQKGSEKWQIARGSAQLPAGVKVGSKVTVMYGMTATSVTAKK